MKKILFLVVLSSIFLSSCLKKNAMKEVEDQLILNYIFDTGLDFDTTTSGAIFHKTYTGEGNFYSKNDIVPIVYDGFYLNNSSEKVYFAENDTFNLIVGSRDIMKGWNEILPKFKEGGAGIIIFPYYIAFENEHTPNIPPNSTLYYFFRIASESYRISQTALFWNYVEQYDSIITVFEDSLCYIKYFDGLGDIVNNNGTTIDFSMTGLSDTIITSSSSHFLETSSYVYTPGLMEAVNNMQEGEMGKVIVPPQLAFTDDNTFNITPFSAIIYEVRAISSDPDIEEKSKIDKYLLSNSSPDSVLSSGIYYFEDKTNDSTQAFLNANISYSDSIYLINQSNVIEGCYNCTSTLNSSNFTDGMLESILLMKAGEEATFIIPYSEAYGSAGQGNIPPYSTLIYKVKLINVD